MTIFAVSAVAPYMTHSRGVAAELPSGHPSVGFNRDVRPILSDKCFRCHGPDSAARQADLRLDVREAAIGGRDGVAVIVPGHPEQSEVYRRLVSRDPDEQMPPPTSELSLTDDERETIRRWIAEGANYEPHWAFVPPVRPPVPQLGDSAGIRNPIDAFVRAKLRDENLPSAPEADPATLCRRLYLDLTGIPPTPKEVENFVAGYAATPSVSSPPPPVSLPSNDREIRRGGDKAKENAYVALVDKLLASPRYGERMAAPWLDAARYADTNGYQTDGPRYMWRWRDWVIDAFNRNLPYDQFTVEQLAGDLLPNPTLDQLIATGFNRNHRMNAEGGIIAEEFLVEYVVDRVETTSTVWLGLTMGCARCHDHKYDPFSQRDFYRLFAYFNNVPEPGKGIRDDNSMPLIKAPTADQQRQLALLRRQLSDAQSQFRDLGPQIAAAEKTWAAGPARQIGEWTFDDGLTARFQFHGNLANDADAENPARVQAVGDAEFGDGPVANGWAGRALIVDGDGQVATTKPPAFDSELPFASSIWIRATASDEATVYAAMDADMSNSGIELRLVAGRPQVVLAARIVDDFIRVESEQAVALDRWTHVAWSYDGSRSAAGVRIFIDGRPTKVRILTDSLTNKLKTNQPLFVGGGGTASDFRGRVADLRFYARELSDDEAAIVSCNKPIRELAREHAAQTDASSVIKLREYFLRHAASADVQEARRAVIAAAAELRDFEKSIPTTMIMRDVDGLRATHILIRGEYDKPGEPVTPGIPPALAAGLDTAVPDRLALARWLVARDNPLTARVAVNRIWQMHFGTGLVKTVEDFGSQGEWPVHQELLDWLAVEFMEGGWEVKALHKLIVCSATYRQASKLSPTTAARDPENRLLARGPRFRLSAEAVRDSALSVAGLLVEQIGGPSVKPYQPEGLWEELANRAAGGDYAQDHGPNLYRRGLYTYRKRTVAQPMLANFDAAGREACVVRQARTNTPLQALNLLNDVTFVEAARALGARMMLEGGGSPSERIDYGFRLALCRDPSERELSILTAGYQRRLAEFRADAKAAEALLNFGESKVDPGLDRIELAAYATVGNVLLNLDEFVTKE